MSKVTITIDDTNPAIVAAFGANSLETIADEFGYMQMVEKIPEELPAKILNEETGVEEYPEGTELYKSNPQSKAEFVARKILEDNIIPRLLTSFKQRRENEKRAEVQAELTQAHNILASTAVIETA